MMLVRGSLGLQGDSVKILAPQCDGGDSSERQCDTNWHLWVTEQQHVQKRKYENNDFMEEEEKWTKE